MIKESRIQQKCYVEFHNKYPALRGLLCYNLNNSGLHVTDEQLKDALPAILKRESRYAGLLGSIASSVRSLLNHLNIRVASANKSIGLVKGRSDMVLYYKGIAYMFEFKKPVVGKQSQHQKKWEELVKSHGFNYFIIDSFENFQWYISQIID